MKHKLTILGLLLAVIVIAGGQASKWWIVYKTEVL